MTSVLLRGNSRWLYTLWALPIFYCFRNVRLHLWDTIPSRLSYLLQSTLYQLQLCKPCRGLVTSFINFSPKKKSGWRLIKTHENIITVRESHLDNKASSLRKSSLTGCPLCKLLYQSLERRGQLQEDETYSIFFWGRLPQTKEIQVAKGSSDQFVKHISQWTRHETLALYWRQPPSAIINSSLQQSLDLPNLPEQNPLSIRAIDFVRTMLHQCENEHNHCCSRPKGPLPVRVLDLGNTSDTSQIRLHLSRKGEMVEYATLSYSWGGMEKVLLTEKATLTQRCEKIDLADFPKTLRDGITIAKALGFRYLWIDSLCIIQDDEEDWAYQSAAMTEIYGYSNLNISASSSLRSDQGFLNTLTEYGLRIRHLSTPDGMATNNIYIGPKLPTLDLEALEVSTRGWIFQERLVSVATVHYTDHGIVWECVKTTKIHHLQSISPPPWKAQWKDLVGSTAVSTSHPDQVIQRRQAEFRHFKGWHDWVSAYSGRNLYEWNDKLPAIAGVARTFASEFSLTYCAGLWMENIRQDLLWARHNKLLTLTRPSTYIAPSWSWASVNGLLEYCDVVLDPPKEKTDLKIIDHFVKEEYPASYGKVIKGHLIVQGLLQPVVLDTNIHPSVRKKPYQACAVVQGFEDCSNVLCTLDEFESNQDPNPFLWCLRVGSHGVYGRQGHVYLLLEWTSGYQTFRRVGFVETDPWMHGQREVNNSGAFTSAIWTQLLLI